MTRHILPAIFLAWFVTRVLAVPPRVEPGPATPEELAAGQALAKRLYSAVPEESSEIRGKLIITQGRETRAIPIVCRVTVKPDKWETDYETTATAQAGAEHLVIIHTPNGPDEYLYARAATPSAALPKMAKVPPADASIPLAGSDFSLAELGMEFLHWPGQRELKDEVRLSQPCYVLESANPGGRQIVRVRSDIDKETGGLLIADAFDGGGHEIKKFSLHGSSFKKIHGHWQLEKMDIQNQRTRSHTELKFDLNQ